MDTAPPSDEPYFQHEAYLGDVPLPGISYPSERPLGLHLRLLVAEEAYRDPPPFLHVRARRGQRVYAHAKAYALVPDYRLTLSLSTAPPLGQPIGRIADVAHLGWRRLDVGHAQAWLYPAEGTLAVWEALLHDRHRAGEDPHRDPALWLLWDGFEGALLRHLAPWGPVRRLVTTWEHAYPSRAWAAFLDQQGYLERPPAAFAQRLLPARPGAGYPGGEEPSP